MFCRKMYAKKSAEWWNGLTRISFVRNIKLRAAKSDSVLHHYMHIYEIRIRDVNSKKNCEF